MSCFNNYLPNPPRDWSRVQNSCIELTLSEANQIAISNKKNVLQYKANSSNLTKAQKYSNIAKGFNNNTTWATQSTRSKYTNPNTKNLERSGNILSCPQIVIPIDENLLFNVKYVNIDTDISTTSKEILQEISSSKETYTPYIFIPEIYTPVKVTPQPPRVWYRVQNPFIELSPLEADTIAMLNKGNVLQYKANSSNLTKAQKYSKIANNRNTTWATQSARGYTNPNISNLKRNGNVANIAISSSTGQLIGPTLAPITCQKSIIINNENLPNSSGITPDIPEPVIPPPVEPTSGRNVFPNIIPVIPAEPVVIQDGGVLICSVQENVCTGETKSTISQKICNPTTDSNVPGQIQELCWNDGTQTWFPRQRYIMTNSGNKFPYNYKF